MKARYIGEDCVYADPIAAQSIMLENGKAYDIETEYEGPQLFVNNQMIAHPDATVWVSFPDKNIRMPYAPDLVDSQWRVMEDDSSR